MDTKKVLQQLIKIADSQQKVINKLAQTANLNNSAGINIRTDKIKSIMDHLIKDPKIAAGVAVGQAHLDKDGGTLTVSFNVDPTAAQAWEAVSPKLQTMLAMVPLYDTSPQGQEHHASTVSIYP